jgi:hypothetical protein
MKLFARLSTLLVLAFTAGAGCDSDDSKKNTTDTGDTSSPDTNDTTPDATVALPSQVTCSGDTCSIEAPPNNPITQSFRMTADKRWLLKGGVFIGNDTAETVLTIDEGTTIYGETSSKAFITIRRGSKINAIGSVEKPIVFTSSKSPGSRARGDWGGLVINGRAPVNGCDTAPCEPEGEGGTGKYGGSDAADSSGTLRYVRVEFAGFPITEDNELNGIAFQGVGNGTTLEYIQVHMASDDGVEFFGGTANFKYVLTTGISDDNLDWTDGWRGKGQFFVAQQYEDTGDNGIEADNNGDNNDALPRSSPELSNLTLIGVPTATSSDDGILLREGTGAKIHNSIIMGWERTCMNVDHAATFANAADMSGNPTGIVITNSIFSCATNFKENDEVDANDMPIADPWSLSTFVLTKNTGNRTADPMLSAPLDTVRPGLVPKVGSPALTGAVKPADAFFDDVDFIGGIDPNDDWTQGWTTSARN